MERTLQPYGIRDTGVREYGSTGEDFQAKNLTVNDNVGIGRSNPGFKLDVDGVINANEIFRNGAPLSISQWTTVAAGIHYSDGNVGIGTTEPRALLHLFDQRHDGFLGEILFSSFAGLPDFSKEADFGYTGGKDSDFWFTHLGSTGGKVRFRSALADPARRDLLTIQNDGKVGIGTANPEALLHLSDQRHNNFLGDIYFSSFAGPPDPDSTPAKAADFGYNGGNDRQFWFVHFGGADGAVRFRWAPESRDLLVIHNTGVVEAPNCFQGRHCDFAENFSSDVELEAGDVVCLDENSDKLVLSKKLNDTLIIGIVSTAPGFVLNAGGDREQEEKLFPIALNGCVPCKVTDENGSIHRGDLLTASSIPGHAMKAKPIEIDGEVFYRPNTIIGKALTSLESGKGVIDVFVSLR